MVRASPEALARDELEHLGVRDGVAIYLAAAAAALMPPEELTIDQWATRARRLPEWSRAPGPWRNETTPYLVEPMRALSPSSTVESVALMFGSQLGKTEVLLNTIGYALDVKPDVVIVLLPKKEQIRKWVRTRVDPMIANSAQLRRRVTERKKDSGNSMLLKESSNGAILTFLSANIGDDLRSTPARVVLMDEIDIYVREILGEGDPVTLVQRATRTYEGSKKIAFVSTPTIKGRSRIAELYAWSDRSVYLVPCPFCETRQVIGWNHRRDLHWPHSKMVWERGDYESVRMICAGCNEPIEEGWKTEMLAAGEWKAERPALSDRKRGFWLSGLYAPAGFYSWKRAAEEWEAATGTSHPDGMQDEGGRKINVTALRPFVNQTLAEEFEEKGDAPEWELLYRRRESYQQGVVPKGGLILTAGVDIQKNRIEYEVVAWGRGFESWSVEYVELPGDTSKPQVWQELWKRLGRHYDSEEFPGYDFRIRRVAVDSADQSEMVYSQVRRQPADIVLAIRGRESSFNALLGRASTPDVTGRGKSYARGVRVWPVGVSIAKTRLYGWLKMDAPLERDAPMPAGWCHFPDYGESYFRGLCSEQLMVKQNKLGRIVLKWKVTFERNEPLDCRVYAYAVTSSLGMERFKDSDWAELEATLRGTLGKEPKKEEPGPLDRMRGRKIELRLRNRTEEE